MPRDVVPLLVETVRTQPAAKARMTLIDLLPWVRALPVDDIDQMIAELVGATCGTKAPDLPGVAVLLTQWRHTAEIFLDPVLLAHVTREPEGDFGPVQTAPSGGLTLAKRQGEFNQARHRLRAAKRQ